MQASKTICKFRLLNFTDEKSFNSFNKNLTGEIYRLFLTLARAVKKYNPLAKNRIEHKLERAIISYIDLKNCFTTSLNTVISQDGKATELQDLIPSKKWVSYEESKSVLFDEEDINNNEIKIKSKYNKRQVEQTENLQMAFGF